MWLSYDSEGFNRIWNHLNPRFPTEQRIVAFVRANQRVALFTESFPKQHLHLNSLFRPSLEIGYVMNINTSVGRELEL